jgi:hypothetical protein
MRYPRGTLGTSTAIAKHNSARLTNITLLHDAPVDVSVAVVECLLVTKSEMLLLHRISVEGGA